MGAWPNNRHVANKDIKKSGKHFLVENAVRILQDGLFKFPVTDIDIPDHFGQTLFRMSSSLPDGVAIAAREKGYSIANVSKGFFYNVEPIEIVDFFDIGTRASSKSLMLR